MSGFSGYDQLLQQDGAVTEPEKGAFPLMGQNQGQGTGSVASVARGNPG